MNSSYPGLKTGNAVGGLHIVTLTNELISVSVCPEAARIMEIVNRQAETGYVNKQESRLPENPLAGGIGDVRYNSDWRACKWEYSEDDKRLGGYSFTSARTRKFARVTMRKDALHDQWKDKRFPGLKVERTVRIRAGSPTLEILDKRVNLDSNRHAMVYDLLFNLVPRGGGEHAESLSLPVWARVRLLYPDRRVEVLGREDYAQHEERRDDVLAVLLTETDWEDGVLVEFDRPQQVELRTTPGGGWEKSLFLSVRRPFRLERYETLTRLFKVTPYPLDRERIDGLFADWTPGACVSAIALDIESALERALAGAADPMSRGMLKGLARLGRQALKAGGPANARWARECVAELDHLAALLAAGKRIHRQFFDDAFLAEKLKLVRQLSFKRRRRQLRDLARNIAVPERIDNPYTPQSFMDQAVEAICFDDRKTLKRLAGLFTRYFFPKTSFLRREIDSATIGNANWCLPLLIANEALGKAGMLDEDELAVTYEIIWTQARLIDDYGCGIHGNWGTMERSFLAHVGLVFAGARAQPHWMEKAVECMDSTILGDCSPDGGWAEPPGYTHWAMLRGIQLMEILGRSGALGKALAERDRKLRRMMEYQWRLMNSNDLLPEIGDGWYVFRADIYMPFARRYRNPHWTAACLRHGWTPTGHDLLFSGPIPATGRLIAKPAKRKTDLLPHDGYALFRSGDAQLTLFYGYQSGHGHFDTLSFLLHVRGKDFISEHVAEAKVLGCGYGARFSSLWCGASRSHCMALVDDKTYTERQPAKCLLWKVNGARARGIFQAPAYPGVTVTREIRQEPGTFRMIDIIRGRIAAEPADKAPPAEAKSPSYHTWRAFFPGTARVEKRGRTILVTLDGDTIRTGLDALDKDIEIVIDEAPPKDFPPTEPITRRGHMLLLRKPIGADQQTVFDVRIDT